MNLEDQIYFRCSAPPWGWMGPAAGEEGVRYTTLHPTTYTLMRTWNFIRSRTIRTQTKTPRYGLLHNAARSLVLAIYDAEENQHRHHNEERHTVIPAAARELTIISRSVSFVCGRPVAGFSSL